MAAGRGAPSEGFVPSSGTEARNAFTSRGLARPLALHGRFNPSSASLRSLKRLSELFQNAVRNEWGRFAGLVQERPFLADSANGGADAELRRSGPKALQLVGI